MVKRGECDKCKSPIIEGRCKCGVWVEEGQHPYPMQILRLFFESLESPPINDPVFSADHPLGWSCVFFKGTYEDSEKVKEFIRKEIVSE